MKIAALIIVCAALCAQVGLGRLTKDNLKIRRNLITKDSLKKPKITKDIPTAKENKIMPMMPMPQIR